MARNVDLTKIKGFTFDIDGVFTDGGILCDLAGELFRVFDAKDGFAIRMARMHGYPVGIITGGRSGSIRNRFLTCGVPQEDVYLGSRDKIIDFEDFCRRHSLSEDQVAYSGDDIPDIETMMRSGLGFSPADAVPEIKEIADMVSPYPGGKGCVRDLIESVMKAQGTWEFNVGKYKKLY